MLFLPFATKLTPARLVQRRDRFLAVPSLISATSRLKIGMFQLKIGSWLMVGCFVAVLRPPSGPKGYFKS